MRTSGDIEEDERGRLHPGRTVWARVDLKGEKRRVVARVVSIREHDCFVHPLRSGYENELAEVQDQWVTKDDLELI